MCGRYTLTAAGPDLIDEFQLDEAPSLAPRFNIAPTQEVAVVRLDPAAGRRKLGLLRWGLIPPWAREPEVGSRMINARADTAAVKPAFRAAFKRRRCLIPADGFYEWKPAGARKQPYFIRMCDGRTFAFAGLWERWEPSDGEPIESCTILTTDPNDLLAPIHNRMPVILHREDYGLWLDPDLGNPDRLRPLLAPYAPEEMTAYPVGLRVNSPKNDDAGCIEPMEKRSTPPRILFD